MVSRLVPVTMALAILGVTAGSTQGPAPTQTLVLRGVTLIDGSGRAPTANTSVIIRGERILDVTVGTMNSDLMQGATLLEGRNWYVIPGLIDMHAHPSVDYNAAPEILQTLLAFGITTIRNPAANLEQSVSLRTELASGRLLGPRMFTAGPYLDRITLPDRVERGVAVRVDSVAAVDAEIERQAIAGVDFVKLYRNLPPQLVTAGIAAAHNRGLKVIGHLGATDWEQAVDAGIDVLTHSNAAVGVLPPPGERPATPEQSSTPSNVSGAEYQRRWRSALDVPPSRIDTFIQLLRSRRVELNPTLVMTETVDYSDDARVLDKLEPQFAPASLEKAWRSRPHPYSLPYTQDEFRERRASFPKILELIRRAHAAGVLVTAGTDLGNPWITPGVSFHRELQLLVRAGISTVDVLRIATSNGAQALGQASEIGTVQRGKRADLVVLEANPLDDISNTRRIKYVVKDGKVHDPVELLQERARTSKAVRP